MDIINEIERFGTREETVAEMIPGTAIKTGTYTIYLKLSNPDKVDEIPNELLIGG